MKKALLIGLIVTILALGGIGAAYATGMNFTNVQALSRGAAAIDQINCTGVLWDLQGSNLVGVEVRAVQVRFDKALVNAALAVSLRDGNGAELAYYANNGMNVPANTFTSWLLLVGAADNTINTLPSPEFVYIVRVTAANNSAFNYTPIFGTPGGGDGSWVQP